MIRFLGLPLLLVLIISCSFASKTTTNAFHQSRNTSFAPPAVEGLDRFIETIYLADTPEITGQGANIYQQFQEISRNEGFRVELINTHIFTDYLGKSKTAPWIEDYGVLTESGLLVSKAQEFFSAA